MSKDTEQQLPERPWTPAPWKQDLEPFHIVIVDGNAHAVATTVHDHNGWESPNPEADAQLIALAPEMAEAILGIVTTDKRMNAVAEKLRKIGATNE